MSEENEKRFGGNPKNVIEENLKAVKAKIEKVCDETGRDVESVRLLPVSKTVPADIMRGAFEIGITQFAENKVQEAKDKNDELNDLPIEWAIVGHLQTNKIKYMTKFANEFHALDSIRVAEKMDKRLKNDKKKMNVYIQVNTSQEESKFGLKPDELAEFLDAITQYEQLKPKGLMTLATFSQDKNKVIQCFQLLRKLRDQAVGKHPEITELSMGMTNDFEDAIRQGANVIRVGQGIFGNRPTPDSHYWPGLA